MLKFLIFHFISFRCTYISNRKFFDAHTHSFVSPFYSGISSQSIHIHEWWVNKNFVIIPHKILLQWALSWQPNVHFHCERNHKRWFVAYLKQIPEMMTDLRCTCTFDVNLRICSSFYTEKENRYLSNVGIAGSKLRVSWPVIVTDSKSMSKCYCWCLLFRWLHLHCYRLYNFITNQNIHT